MQKRPVLAFIAFIFIATLFVPFNGTIKAAENSTYTVTTDSLNVRSSPDRNGEVIGKLNKGNQIQKFKEQNGWIQTYVDGNEGWVAAHYLVQAEQESSDNNQEANEAEIEASEKSIRIQADSVLLRSGPGQNYSILSSASTGEAFTVLKEKENWYQIQLANGSNAWVASWLTSAPLNENSDAEIETAPAQDGSLSGRNIMIDAGHGGIDPGSASQNNHKEKDLTLTVAQTVGDKLAAAGANVIYTRNSDTYISPADRANINNDYVIDAFISLHYNAHTRSTTNGISSHYYGGNQDYQLASSIQNSLLQHTPFKDRGVQHDSFLVLRESQAPATLLELGFITNPVDFANIYNDNHAHQIGDAVTEGLIQYFN